MGEAALKGWLLRNGESHLQANGGEVTVCAACCSIRELWSWGRGTQRAEVRLLPR